MRRAWASVFWIIAVTAALAAAASWGYFIWSLDWGHPSYSGRGLWLMLMAFPMAIIFPVVFLGVTMILTSVCEAIFGEKFLD